MFQKNKIKLRIFYILSRISRVENLTKEWNTNPPNSKSERQVKKAETSKKSSKKRRTSFYLTVFLSFIFQLGFQ